MISTDRTIIVKFQVMPQSGHPIIYLEYNLFILLNRFFMFKCIFPEIRDDEESLDDKGDHSEDCRNSVIFKSRQLNNSVELAICHSEFVF